MSKNEPLNFEKIVSNLESIAVQYNSQPLTSANDKEVVSDFLSRQNILNVLHPDLFAIANMFRPLPFLYEKNYRFDLGVEDNSFANVVKYVSPEYLKVADAVDRKLVEFNYKNRLKPFDFVSRTFFEVNCPNPKLKIATRTIMIIATNKDGHGSHGLACLHNVTEQVSRIKYPGYEVKLSPAFAHLEKSLLDEMPDFLPAPYNLTNRECQIIEKLHAGMSSKMIADALSISKHTVDTHRRKILRKLDVGNTPGALQKASSLGII